MDSIRFSKVISNILSLLICGLIPTYAAASIDLTVYGGGVNVETSESKVFFSRQETDLLVGNDNHSNQFTSGVGLAYTYYLRLPADSIDTYPIDSFSLGLDLYNFSATREGVDLLFGLPNFANYTYDMDLRSTRLMLDLQLNSQPFWMGLIAFVEAGAGATRNTVNYHETPLPGITGTGLQLKGNTNYQFAYDLGGGLKLPLTNYLLLSARYLYSNLGNAESSVHGTNTLLEPIKVKLRAQSVLLGLTFSIN